MPRTLNIVAAFTLLAACKQPPAVDPNAPPNVVLVVIDTLRADHLTAYGFDRPSSPNVSALAAEAVRYVHASAQAPWTTPSIGSLLTSRYPSELGIDRYRVPLPDDADLLSELLQAAGYRTGAVVSHSYCASQWNFHQGFDTFDENAIGDHETVSSEQVTDRALRFLEGVEGQPFLLFAHYFDPHFAYIRHDEFPWASDPAYQGPIRSAHPIKKLRRLVPSLVAADWAELGRIYDSEVAFTDQQVGRLLAHLRKQGLYENSLIIVTADHGEEFGDHGHWGHTVRLYDEVTRVPLIIRYPGQPAQVVERPVGLVDVLPTVLAFLEQPLPAGLAGHDLRQETADRPVFSETSKGAKLDAVLFGGHKLIEDRKSGRAELYDLNLDPAEATDLAASEPERLAALTALLHVWRVSLRGEQTGSQVEISTEEAARLEALGYLED